MLNYLQLLLTILSLTLPIYGQKTQEAKKQDKRGIVALGYGGYERGGLALRGGLLSAGYGGIFYVVTSFMSVFVRNNGFNEKL